MPEELWEAAVSAAQEHGLWAVAHALRVNYESLKKRVGSPAKKRTAAPRGFVELDTAKLAGSPAHAGTVLELSGADGATLKIRFEHREALDVQALTEAFWRRRA